MASDTPPILALHDVSKSFGPAIVLDKINLEVPRGSIVALLGASGSGKSTLLQVIAGLLDHDSGSLIVDGQDMRGVPPCDRPVNMMFQNYALFPHLTVVGNIAYGLKARGTARAERERLVDWALQLTRLSGLGARRTDQLSGGQRQRVALARCLVMKPAILLLDEPMAALDRGLRKEMQKELIGIQREVRATFIIVTHDQEEAMGIADYVAVLQDGAIRQFGPSREVYEKPQSRFVASFLGDINLFEGSAVASEHNRLRFQSADGLQLVLDNAGRLQPQKVVAAGFRPESVRVSRNPTGEPNDFPGVVERVGYGGTTSSALIRLSEKRSIAAILLNTPSLAADRLEVGDAVHVGLAPQAGVALSK